VIDRDAPGGNAMLVGGDMRQHRRSGEFLELVRIKAVPVYERFGWVLAGPPWTDTPY
jgi:hypothetical protein